MGLVELRPLSSGISSLVGREDFGGAVDFLRAGLKGDASDLNTLKMIAHCHHWAGHTDEAIAVGREALNYDPTSFEMHAILAQLLADKGEHQEAVAHANQGLLNYPVSSPEQTASPALDGSNSSEVATPPGAGSSDLASQWVSAGRTEWFDWAKSYLSWYESARGETVGPTEH